MTAHSPIRYRIAPFDLNAHLFEVWCTLDHPDPAGQIFRLPAWAPGSYLIREFARNFVSVRAENLDGPVTIVKEGKDTWRVAPCAGPLAVVAKVFAFDVSVRTAYLDATRGYFNGASVFLAPSGREAEPCSLEIAIPSGGPTAKWRIATTLGAEGDGSQTRYHAGSYDELIDHPVEMSDHASASFLAGGVPHDIAITGRQHADLDRVTRDLARICQWHVDLFGGLSSTAPPFARYLFQISVVGEGYGGLEHRSSTSLICRRDSLPMAGMTAPSDDYVGFLGLASHEYFHVWNVKRIKPLAFCPYDLARENYTRQLWAFEGITAYYDDLALARSGVVPPSRLLEIFGRTITSVIRTPGRFVQSVADASFDAWIKFYRPDENSPNATINYYLKGSLVALALDLTLRRSSSRSLDDVMRTLWRRHGQTGAGVPEDGIEAIASEIAGRDLREFFDRYVAGTEDPPLEALLRDFGVMLHLRAATGPTDRGGKAASKDTPPASSMGALLGSDLKLKYVAAGGPAEVAGLAPNDLLVAIDGLKASSEAIASMLKRNGPGTNIAVHAFRRDELMTFDLVLAAPPLDTCYLELQADASPEVGARRAAWLGA